MNNMLPAITVSALDFKRIESLLDALPSSYDDVKDRLFDELDRAAVVEPVAVPPTLVTMNSRVRFSVLATGVTMVKTLVYPKDVAADENNISILTPLGSALLGLSIGQEIEWQIDAQKTMRVRIDAIEYQPERAGDFHL
ncbi:MAG: nucleoside diphosphate kinase regulator [Cellvibrio sp. 79]|nr:MAG: nucleoside diphosphate kinase regulator [Cellvibrio sp. 79]